MKHRRWVILFFAMAMLVLAQVGWWVTLFLKDVSLIESLRVQNHQLELQLEKTPHFSFEEIQAESRRRRFMFWSESMTFALLTCFSLYLMFQLLKAEEHAKKIQRDFIDIVSHESRTPLTALNLRIGSAMEKTDSESAIHRDLSLARVEIKRLASLFENAMSLNRMERQAITTEPILLAQVIEETLRSMDPVIKANAVQLDCSQQTDGPVQADASALRNTIQNLIENGIIYNTKAEKKLSLSLYTMDGKVRLDINDNGPGIPEAERTRIFDQFYRGKKNHRIPGTGLGLYLAQRVIRAHRGEITYLPTEDGSTFRIELPEAT